VNTVYTQQFKVDVVGEYLAGRRIDDICDDYLIDRRRLSVWRQALGAPKRPLLFKRGPPRRVDHADVRRLHARGLSDMAIARELRAGRTTVRDARVALGLKTHFPRAVAALALLLFASGAQAQGTGWQGHGTKMPDPFAPMRNIAKGEPGFSCCHSEDCGRTEQCTPIEGGIGVVGPDDKCHQIPDDAYQVRGCPTGEGTTACFMGPRDHLKMLCACIGAS
jgi:transposase-like protein